LGIQYPCLDRQGQQNKTKQNKKKGHLKCNAFHNLISYGHRKPNHLYNRTSHALTDIHKSLPNLPSITKAATYLPIYLPTSHHHQGCYIDGVGWKKGREGRFFFQCNNRWKLEDLKQLQQVGTSDPLESITQFCIANLQSFGEKENLEA
jgi:hypothetical protein